MHICFYGLFSAFSYLLDLKYWGCLYFIDLYVTSSMLLSFFLQNISIFVLANKNFEDDDDNNIDNKEWICYFFNWIFSQHFLFSADLLQMSGGSMVGRVIYEGSAERENTFFRWLL